MDSEGEDQEVEFKVIDEIIVRKGGLMKRVRDVVKRVHVLRREDRKIFRAKLDKAKVRAQDAGMRVVKGRDGMWDDR